MLVEVPSLSRGARWVLDGFRLCFLVGSSLRCLINALRFLSLLLWFVVGPGGFREAPGGPGKANGGLWGAFRGPPEPGSKQNQITYFLQGPIHRPSSCAQKLLGSASGPRARLPQPVLNRWPKSRSNSLRVEDPGRFGPVVHSGLQSGSPA